MFTGVLSILNYQDIEKSIFVENIDLNAYCKTEYMSLRNICGTTLKNEPISEIFWDRLIILNAVKGNLTDILKFYPHEFI